MNKKIIVASTVGVLGLASIVLGATTFASSTTVRGMGNGSGAKMMQNRKMPIHQFDNTGDATAFKTAVDAAITAKDYTAFKAAHTKYSIEFDMSEEDFGAMITRRAEAKTRQAEHEALREQSQTALENNDYATWAKLNKDTPIGKLITTQAKFTQLQEMHSYQQKAKTIRESLGLPGEQGEKMGQGMGMGQRMKDGMGRGSMKNTTTTNK